MVRRPRSNDKMSIKLFVADDQEIIRHGLRAMVAGTEIEILAEATTGKAALDIMLKRKPQVSLLDVRLPEGDGLSILGRIKLERPDQPVLMMSAYNNPTHVAKAVALGASGFLDKAAGREDFLTAIRRAAVGEMMWSRSALRHVAGALALPRSHSEVEAPLTKRETDVLTHLARGLTNKQIADVLEIGYETVKEHIQHILTKLGLRDRTQAAIWAVRKNLL